MKKLLPGLFSLLSITTFAAGWETIKGNGVVKKETRSVSGYSGLSLSGNMNVQVAYGTSNSISVEADENLLPYIETVVEDGKLLVRTKKGYNLKTKTRMVVNVSMTKISTAKLSGSGNISGSGNFDGAENTQVTISGSGNIHLGFNDPGNLDISISGSGNATLKGSTCNNVKAQISGSGNIDCSAIHAETVKATISGSGNVSVYAGKSIDARVSGSGSLYYKGEAAVINSKTSGSGKVIKS